MMSTTGRTRWPLYFLLIAMVGCLVGAAWVFQSGRAVEARPQDSKHPVSQHGLGVVCVGKVDLESGILQLAPLQPGSVTEVLVYEGQAVKKGDALLKVNDDPFVPKVAEAQSGVNIAEKQLAEARQAIDQHNEIVRAQEWVVVGQKEQLAAAEAMLKRLEKFLSLQLSQPSQEEVETARRKVNAQAAVVSAEEARLEQIKKSRPDAKVDQAVKNVELKKALLDQAREQLNRCTLTAPQDGLVLQIQATVGSQFSTQPNHPAIILAPNQPRIIRVEVDQEFASRITMGAIAQIQDEANNTGPTFVGKVIRIGDAFLKKRAEFGPEIITNGGDSRVLEVIVSMEDANPLPKLGQRMRVSIGPSR